MANSKVLNYYYLCNFKFFGTLFVKCTSKIVHRPSIGGFDNLVKSEL